MAPASAMTADAAAVAPPSAMLLLSEPIPFVMLSEDSTFEIAPEAVAYLKQIKGTVAVVSIAGLYRTGKSYLLNLLLGRDRAEAMFNVGATVNACTKGIWIWGQPVQLSAVADLATESAFKHLPKDTTIVFMDTEGLGSTQRSQTQDTRIFALALLLSSLFIYNSRGVIDSSAIEDLSLVVNLTKYIQAKAHAGTEEHGGENGEEGSELAAFFPDFLWVVRDFTLQLQEEGRKMSPRDYFESALKHQPPMTEEIAQKNRIRTLLSTFFPVRDCVTMVRPLNDENLLRNLIHQPYDSLRPEFQEQMTVLKTKVFSSLKPKKMMTNVLNGAMLISLAQNYVDAFNSGSSPVIATVWDRVIESQCDDALESAKNVFTKHFEAAIAEATTPIDVNHIMLPRPIEDSEINKVYEKARQAAEKELQLDDISATSSMETYWEQLSQYMLDLLQDAYAKCKELSIAYNKALLKELYKPKEETFDTTPSSRDDGAQALQNSLTDSRALIEDVVTKYRNQSLGSGKSVVLSEFLSEQLVEGLIEWGTAVKTSFRSSETKLEGEIGALKQTLRVTEGKVRAAQEVLTQQKESFERALLSITERTADERSNLEDEMRTKQSEIDRVHLQIERLAALHKEALDRLGAQLEESKDERKRLEEEARDEQLRRENERQEANRQLLESERNFHKEEKDLLQNQQHFLQKIIDLERQLGEQDTEQMKEIFRLEKESQQQSTELTLKYQDDKDELKEQTIQTIRSMKSEQDEELAVFTDELNEKKALLSSLREQLEAKEAIAEMKKAKANSFFGNKEDCVLQ
uniref:GB1/RHD3-type G domain-containing protein n=1 Tax=Globisporangium ultimum (strain ATCC 200006 / CBS 805.95 / DAOM BR144) TaxID=431595 RepID=K3W833_GLOUD